MLSHCHCERKSERDSMRFLWLQSARWLGFQGGTDKYNFDISCGSGRRLKMFASGRFRRSYATAYTHYTVTTMTRIQSHSSSSTLAYYIQYSTARLTDVLTITGNWPVGTNSWPMNHHNFIPLPSHKSHSAPFPPSAHVSRHHLDANRQVSE